MQARGGAGSSSSAVFTALTEAAAMPVRRRTRPACIESRTSRGLGEQALAGSDAPPAPLLQSAARRPRALEAIENQVQPERELDIVVARAEHALVACGNGQLGNVRVAGRDRLRERR